MVSQTQNSFGLVLHYIETGKAALTKTLIPILTGETRYSSINFSFLRGHACMYNKPILMSDWRRFENDRKNGV